MTQLNLPEYPFKLRQAGSSTEIFDEVRRKWLVCTPEEWVRQNLVMYLHHHLAYPLTLMEIEKGLQVGKTLKRADVVLSNNAGEPIMIIECKAPEIKLNQAVMDQAGRYNIPLKVPYLMISNGMQHFCCQLKNKKWRFAKEIPHWNTILSS